MDRATGRRRNGLSPAQRSGMGIRLPGRITTRYSFGDQENQLGDYGWINDNSNGQTQPVGAKKPNAWGLYNMRCNVWEWCQDWFDEKYYYEKVRIRIPRGLREGLDPGEPGRGLEYRRKGLPVRRIVAGTVRSSGISSWASA